MRLLGCIVLLGCARDPVQAICPSVGKGELAVTEVRGKQSPEDSLGNWIEIANLSGTDLDLQGLQLRIRKADGSSESDVIVRTSVPVDAGGYATLGQYGTDEQIPTYIDYAMAGDYTETWLTSAAIDVDACGEIVDRLQYAALPTKGTLSLGGEPSADRNDLTTNFCTNPTAAGTPQQANPACP